ncbi:MAG: hypothetical protein JO265_00235 [Acidimicrobiia bacterium]|nr:hypothetical protein [Acidimicrobiia bacterium]
MQRSKLPSVIMAALVAIAVAGIALAFSGTRRPPPPNTTAIVRVTPPPGDLDLRQVSVGVTLAAGYTGDLFVDGAQVPEDELHREPVLYQITLQPRPGSQFDLGPGRHCASVRYWPLASPSDTRDSAPWCFSLH